MLHDDRTGAVLHLPADLRIVAAIEEGFLALDRQSRWVVWSPSETLPVAPAGGQLLAAGVHTIAIQYACGDSGCPIVIADPGRGTSTRRQLQLVPQYAVFSPDDTRLALAAGGGEVELLDASSGREIVRTAQTDATVASLPLSWTADSRMLLVVRRDEVDILRGADGTPTGSITGTAGLEQLVALP
jgi:hypothetical protein